MSRELRFKPTADKQLAKLENSPALAGILNQVRKVLGYLETNLKANSLQTKPHHSLTMRYDRKIFESYIQQGAPGAYRIFWYYGDDELDKKGKRISIITIITITPHP